MTRVLWFSLSPCGSMRKNCSMKVTQGWMISLEDEIKKDPSISLSVAYYCEDERIDFEYEGVHYYPMSIRYGTNKLQRLRHRLLNSSLLDKILLKQLLHVVELVKPNIIHICGTESNFGLISQYINVPIVYSIQGLIAPYKEKFFSGLPCSFVLKHDSLKNWLLGNSIRAKYTKFSYEANREIGFLKDANYIIGRTEWDYNVTHLFNSKIQYFCVNEILREDFYNNQWSKDSFSHKLRFVSIVSPGIYKGFETLLHSAALLCKLGNISFTWNVIGLSSDDKYVTLCERYKRLKSNSCCVSLLGKKDAHEIVEILKESDVFCHTGHIENSPNSVCEAMMMGMPIIATYSGGTCSMLEHGKEGYLVQDGDPYSLAGAILNIIGNFDKAKEMGINARNRAMIRHNKNRIVESLIESYIQIIKAHKNA